MSRMSVALDDGLVEVVKRRGGFRTKREAIEMALHDYPRRKRVIPLHRGVERVEEVGGARQDSREAR